MDNCIFCKIVDGHIPSYKVYEDEDVIAFLDISQATKGHTLVVPKKHKKNIFELGSEGAINVFSVVPKLCQALKKAFKCEGINIVSNNGEAAGQTVMHFHVHLIPRYDITDKFHIEFGNNSGVATEGIYQEIMKLIKDNI